jgi:hypothetical protein
VNGHAANAPTSFNDQDFLAKFSSLDGCPAAGWTASDHNEVVMFHA